MRFKCYVHVAIAWCPGHVQVAIEASKKFGIAIMVTKAQYLVAVDKIPWLGDKIPLGLGVIHG